MEQNNDVFFAYANYEELNFSKTWLMSNDFFKLLKLRHGMSSIKNEADFCQAWKTWNEEYFCKEAKEWFLGKYTPKSTSLHIYDGKIITIFPIPHRLNTKDRSAFCNDLSECMEAFYLMNKLTTGRN